VSGTLCTRNEGQEEIRTQPRVQSRTILDLSRENKREKLERGKRIFCRGGGKDRGNRAQDLSRN